MNNFRYTATILFVLLLTMITPIFGADFGPTNPFFSPSTLPFQAPAFDKITNADYQPAMEAGMVEHLKEIEAIANNSAAPTFEKYVCCDGKERPSSAKGSSRFLCCG